MKVAFEGRKEIGDNCRRAVARCADIVPLDQAELAFSVLGTHIYTPDEIASVPFGIVNLHLAPLPAYRGFYAFSHAVANGENEFGVTLHYVDEGIDTGPIIARRRVPMSEDPKQLAQWAEQAGEALFGLWVGLILDRAERGLMMPSYPQTGERHYYDRDSLPKEFAF